MIDPVALAAELIRRPSVTPQDAGALGVLESALKPLGFECHRLKFDDPAGPPVENLFAKKAVGEGRHFCFAGHTDVVPPGPRENWVQDPFSGAVANGRLTAPHRHFRLVSHPCEELAASTRSNRLGASLLADRA